MNRRCWTAKKSIFAIVHDDRRVTHADLLHERAQQGAQPLGIRAPAYYPVNRLDRLLWVNIHQVVIRRGLGFQLLQRPLDTPDTFIQRAQPLSHVGQIGCVFALRLQDVVNVIAPSLSLAHFLHQGLTPQLALFSPASTVGADVVDHLLHNCRCQHLGKQLVHHPGIEGFGLDGLETAACSAVLVRQA
ncbi:MAG: hypothetical protein A3E79_08955 [Burkholderiales bacterium RIFCSPHIGHO2_12_FULL_61_11]|nr:MAG: hypothetical protein A3E79_08955 [Burkholderiales bacterium RIFCSPHIGHO2_12_FULL_61_11]